MPGKDKYKNFEELSQNEKPEHFQIHYRKGRSNLAVLAPHGGKIETGTSEIADEIAGREHTFYTFYGRRRNGNRDLHITSANFDEPTGAKVAEQSEKVLAVHGWGKRSEAVCLGGLDDDLKENIQKKLNEAGFSVVDPPAFLAGADPNNICNRGRNGCGVQIEISEGLRRKMFEDYTTEVGRSRTTQIFRKFVSAVREAIAESYDNGFHELKKQSSDLTDHS
jgi:phage replication-related protein YjqB (UPF0714/DUF867 family)